MTQEQPCPDLVVGGVRDRAAGRRRRGISSHRKFRDPRRGVSLSSLRMRAKRRQREKRPERKDHRDGGTEPQRQGESKSIKERDTNTQRDGGQRPRKRDTEIQREGDLASQKL